MNVQEIHSRLKARFGDGIGEWTAPEAGDPFIQVQPTYLREVCKFLRDEADLRFDFLRLISAVDWTDRLSSTYHLYSYEHHHGVTLRVDLLRAAPRVGSVADVWPAADWHEREAYDMMGIVYEGHPALKRILLPDDWAGYPLRKDYKAPEEYNGMTNR
jgi:NADH-quinone oxidoreductase subunit C